MNRMLSRHLFALVAAGLTCTAALSQDDPFPLPPRDWPSPVMDTQPFSYLLLDRLEYRSQPGADLRVWDAQAWFGGDWNKLWLKTEGENEVGGGTEDAELQALYARRISPFWYLQAGVRGDRRSGAWRNSAVAGVQGLAPYWFEVEAMLFADRKGLSGRAEAETDLLLTQRLILQPRVETQFSGYTDRARGIGSGFQDLELGLRLRYEIRREFAPYIGVNWTRMLGNTARIARSQGEDTSVTSVVVGIRAWY